MNKLRQAASIAVILCIVLVVWSVAATAINPVPDDPKPGWLPAPPEVALATWNGLLGFAVSGPRSHLFPAVVTLEAARARFGLRIVSELPTCARAGVGARLLIASYAG